MLPLAVMSAATASHECNEASPHFSIPVKEVAAAVVFLPLRVLASCTPHQMVVWPPPLIHSQGAVNVKLSKHS